MKVPAPIHAIGEWFTRFWHTPGIDGRIESSIGDRSGEPHPGDCLEGDDVAEVDVSAVPGTLSVFVMWMKDNGVVHGDSLTFQEIDTIIKKIQAGANPADVIVAPIELTTEVDTVNKKVIYSSDKRYYGILLKSDGDFFCFLAGEDQAGAALRGCGMSFPISAQTIMFTTDEGVPYNIFNELGGSDGRSLNIRSTDTLIDSYSYEGSGNNLMRHTYEDLNGNSYEYTGGFQTDGSGNLINDPEGVAQGWVTHNGKTFLNAYKDYSLVTHVVGSQELNVNGVYPAGKITFHVEILEGTIEYFRMVDDALYLDLVSAINAVYGSGATPSLALDLFYALNGGSVQGSPTTISEWIGGNGIDDDYPNTTLGINTANGYLADATSTSFRAILDSVLKDSTHAELLFHLYSYDLPAQSIVDPANSNATTNNVLSRNYSLQFSLTNSNGINGTGEHLIEFETTNTLATGARGGVNNAFFLDYEREFETFSLIRLNDYLGDSITWFRFYQFSIQAFDKVSINLLNLSQDSLGNKPDYTGKLRLPIQAAKAWCLLGDGVWSLQTTHEPTTVTVHGIDVTADVTITDNGDGTWDTLFPDEFEVYDLDIDSIHYPVVQQADVTLVASSNSANVATIVAGTYSPVSIWQTQDVYHWNAYQTFETTREFDVDVESVITVPECPQMRAAGFDPTAEYTVAELQAINNNKIFIGQANGRARKLVAYGKTNSEIIAKAEKYVKS